MKAQFGGPFSIEGKAGLVAGGSRGIGQMIAAGFLANGAKAYISSRKADACVATAERLRKDDDVGRHLHSMTASDDFTEPSARLPSAQRAGRPQDVRV